MRFVALTFIAVSLFCGVLSAADYGLKEGKTAIKVAGPMSFGPDGILFVGDPESAHVFAFEIDDVKKEAREIAITNVTKKISDATGQDGVKVNDLAIHPDSGTAYVSFASKDGPGIVSIAGDEVKSFPIDSAKHSKIELTNAPAPGGEGRRNKRAQSITDLAFLDGSLLVAGLANEKAPSKMRSITFPFAETDAGSSIEIYHGAHGKRETNSPAQTFVPLNIGGEPHVVAAYICTPLVRYPVSAITDGEETVEATTVAELGNRNKPLDMLAYEKDGKNYLLLSNSARGVMKIAADDVDKVDAIKDRVERGATSGLTYDTIENLKGVVQLDRLDEGHVVAMIESDGKFELQTFELP